MRHAFLRFALLSMLAVLCAGLVAGQATMTYGRIEGQAKDQTGGVIPGVTVSVTSATGTKTMVTGEIGRAHV